MFQVLMPFAALSNPLPRMDLPLEQRATLALSFARDTAAALSGSARVIAVTAIAPDEKTANVLRGHRISTTVAPRLASLGESVDEAVRVAGRFHRTRVAVVVSDLPALTTDEVNKVLLQVIRHEVPAFVPDLEHRNASLVAARPYGVKFDIGAGSVARHLAQDHAAVAADCLGLRCDVDDLDTLARAAELGLGRHTRRAMGCHPDREISA